MTAVRDNCHDMAGGYGNRDDKYTCHLVCMAVDIRKHLLSFPLESPTDVTWFEIYGRHACRKQLWTGCGMVF
jgi:hypothetical protein